MSQSIEKLIFYTIDQINQDLGVDIKKEDNSDIVGGSSPLDSLGIISFLMELENKVEEEFDIDLTLVNDDVLSEDGNPLRNVLSIKRHLENIINQK